MISALELQARGYEGVNAFTAPQAGLWHAGPAPVKNGDRPGYAEALGRQLRKSDGLVTAELRGTTIRKKRIALQIEVLNLRNVNDVYRVTVAEDESLNRIDA
jgi:hypothetical protein